MRPLAPTGTPGLHWLEMPGDAPDLSTPDFNTIVETHSSRVFNLAFRITGNRHDAEDVVQDTFLQVFRGLESFRGESTLSTWIYRIALNAALRVKRKIGDAASLDALEDRIQAMADEVPDEVRSWFSDPSKATFVNALLTEINQGCLQFMTFRLTDEQRVVYIMRMVLEFSTAEIAEVLEVPEGVVKARLHRARAKLERYFNARCQWLNPENPGCTCQSRVGFAIALDPEILRRVRMNASKSPEAALYASSSLKQIGSISALYEKLPSLQYKAETVKNYLRDLEKKNRA
jgi:RNA polymerase sigma-70 factor (ECF subfamily)